MLAHIEHLLKQTIGLDVNTLGPGAVARAVKQRQAALGLSDIRAYWALARDSDTEVQELVEAVIVPETWFFREPAAFEALADIVQRQWLPTHPSGVLRLLSVPCSTGEEPYSMAMALIDAHVPAPRFRIDAIDISRNALDKARRHVYEKNSFRAKDLRFRERHFAPTPQGHLLDDDVCRQVKLRQQNIFSSDFENTRAVYDIIFCRNVLIYFDREMQDRAMTTLESLMTRTGWLFVGSSEAALLRRHGFVSAKVKHAFGFRKREAALADAGASPPAPRRTPAAGGRESEPRLPARQRRAAFAVPATPLPPPLSPAIATPIATPPAAPVALAEAVRCANQGQLNEAALCCENHMRVHGPSAEAFYVLALVNDAQGNRRDAAAYYRKVLYLAPDHIEALAHLACLQDQIGNRLGAKLLHQRRHRAQARQKTR